LGHPTLKPIGLSLIGPSLPDTTVHTARIFRFPLYHRGLAQTIAGDSKRTVIDRLAPCETYSREQSRWQM